MAAAPVRTTRIARPVPPIGIYSSTVSKMPERYPLPMEQGNRMDTRWVAVTDGNGVGLMITSVQGENFNFSALPYTPQALFDAPTRRTLPVPATPC